MKIPLTITAAVWNYCQNNCAYCVSGSHRKEWNYKGRFEVFRPPGGEGMNDQGLRAKFGPNYYDNLCTDKTLLNAKDVLQFDHLAAWCLKHAPDCEIHLSGGEPLLRPDIEKGVSLLCDLGLSVTILTNGMLIPKRPALLDLPIRWHVTHHAQNPLAAFLAAVEPIRDKPHLMARVLVGTATARNRKRLETSYKGFNFFWKGCNRPRLEHAPPGTPGRDRVASGVLHFITPDGRVFPCNSLKWGEIGHVYLGTYDRNKARQVDAFARGCVMGNYCGAYVTAWQMTHLNELDFFESEPH